MSSTNNEHKIKSILIIGIKGGLAQKLALNLTSTYPEAEIIGVDSRKTHDLHNLYPIKTFTINYTRGSFENLFRNHDFDVVYHVGRISQKHQGTQYKISKYLDLELLEIRRVLELCLQTHVKKVIILSSFHVYGALPDNPVFIKENSPTRASLTFPSLLNILEIDEVCSQWIWQNQEKIQGILLRPCHIVGPNIHNDICKYLRTSYAPYPIDFNPMFQVIHESDMANVLTLCTSNIPTGVYNVAPDEFMAIRDILHQIDIPKTPTPFYILSQISSFIQKGLPRFPSYLIDYLKYPCLIDNSSLKKHLPENFYQFSISESIKATVADQLKNKRPFNKKLRSFFSLG